MNSVHLHPFFCSPLLYNTCFLALSSLAWAFICCTSRESTRRRRINKSWFPMHSWRICTKKTQGRELFSITCQKGG